ncbi:MAG: hypothetical protein HOI23_06700 [Deltaproteobacteria bacterium]|nr:hypothetical protein [Deltaproteobacteria bacterium]MBT6489471.1 hypothetical protein [Deltaproteobacteria bacterium]
MPKFSRIILLVILTTQVGCIEWFSGKIGTGVARLTVRNVGAMLLAVNNDDVCGFASAAVNDNPEADAAVGGSGSLTYTVTDCEIEYTDWESLSTDCNDVETRAKGKLIISARKIVEGRITGNPEKAVIPTEATGARFIIENARFENFISEKSNSEAAMNMISGSISAVIEPLLAKGENGTCSILTPNIQFSEISYGTSLVHVDTGDRDFEVDVDSSNIEAQNGNIGDHQNRISGDITVWGKHEPVPHDEDGLDPEFNEEVFADSFSCVEDLFLPVAYECPLEEKLGLAAGRLAVRDFAGLAKLVATNTQCGFESPEVLNSFTYEGDIGYNDGRVTYTVSNCEIFVEEPLEVSVDCNGEQTLVQGFVKVSGTKVVEGYLTGDSQVPVVPDSMAPAVIQLEAQVIDFSVTQTNSEKYLTINKGTLSGSLTPRTIMDNETGACKLSTPHSIFRDVRLLDALTTVTSSGSQFDVAVEQADLFAVNGQFEDYENYLDGSLMVDGDLISFPITGEEPSLDPEYDADVFHAAFDCVENSTYVDTDEACFFEKTLAQGAARLLVKTYGVITKTVDSDTDCGFDNKLDQIWEFVDTSLLGPAFTGDPVSVDWAVDQCVIGGNEREVVAEDCSGNVISIDGTASITGSKSVTGQLNLSGTPLHPLNRRSAEFEFTRIDLNNFAAMEQKSGAEESGPFLMFHSGTLTGLSHPVTGEAADSPGAYFIKTPVSGFESVAVDAHVTLHNDGKIFHLILNGSDLDAFNGSYGFQTNSLMGDLWVNGTRYRMETNGEEMELNPDYDQDAFDASYACKENLLEVVPAAQ